MIELSQRRDHAGVRPQYLFQHPLAADQAKDPGCICGAATRSFDEARFPAGSVRPDEIHFARDVSIPSIGNDQLMTVGALDRLLLIECAEVFQSRQPVFQPRRPILARHSRQQKRATCMGGGVLCSEVPCHARPPEEIARSAGARMAACVVKRTGSGPRSTPHQIRLPPGGSNPAIAIVVVRHRDRLSDSKQGAAGHEGLLSDLDVLQFTQDLEQLLEPPGAQLLFDVLVDLEGV